MAFHVV